ncbi:hypothetical protein ZYGR_0A03770 [Zygosaccharomyces rouxii]|uniref:ZYRO0A08536p n=2 Tax=Zygosaccharomyces rouxii TaxID=4956 RepID=C5DQ45_ZYGRC|nr:uncharacterized protein ZYRO0A08536g [Zygosaccharomyces rouxii]KAH9198674.1 hypothetical protein LQ764DRAFT_139898 [Zygosaccharomyces rouxii]GAV46781.1 hypothetical protein ZYGR_0A03770 [Zygosaccharomyces rouxii]CAR25806.1 ZYRO0A08536p [Zygosaccharomyces rouxii]
MSAAKTTTMRALPTAEEAGSGSTEGGNVFGRTRHPVLSRSISTSAKVPSVPYLLNISGETTTSATDEDPRSTLTPPASSTKMQFLSSQGYPGSGSSLEGSPLESRTTGITTTGSALSSGRRRQSSMDSLMRAAATVENDNELNQLYQDKLSFIIELKNCISDEIRNWPVVQDPEELSSTPTSSNSRILLDRVSNEQLSSLGNVVCRLKETVEELVELKSQTPHIKENMASKLQRDLRVSTPQQQPRKVVLPPMESLTMNLPHQERTAFHGYRFPSGPTSPATAIPPQEQQRRQSQQQQQQQRQPQDPEQRHHQPPPPRPPPTQHQVISSWPSATQPSPTEPSHRFTLSDPSAYVGRTTMPMIFKSSQPQQSQAQPQSIIPGKKNPKNLKFQKKRKKSLTEVSLAAPQNYRRSLTQGLLIAENVRQTEQATTSCVHCKEGITPEWRRGPYGNRTLCNACGLFYRKLIKKFSTRDANILMRYKRQVNPEDRRVPSALDVPELFISQLENDPNLDSEFNTIGGLVSNYKLG